MDEYSKLKLSDDQIRNSINLQVLAYLSPKTINWPPEPWTPANQLDRILKDIRNHPS